MSGPTPFPAGQPSKRATRVGLALGILALVGYLMLVAGALLVGGVGWALLLAGGVALLVALRADLL